MASVFPQERASERVQQHAARKGVPRFREETVVGVRSGEAKVPEIIIVSDAVKGTFVELDGEGVGLPVPQIAAKSRRWSRPSLRSTPRTTCRCRKS